MYGELLSGQQTDPVHHETIRERSSQHDWTIRLHRHRSLAQVFLFRSDNVALRVGDAARTTAEPHILFVPAGVVHGFRFDEDIEGDVLTLRTDALGPGIGALLALPAMRSACLLTPGTGETFGFIAALLDQVRTVYRGMNVERAEALNALTRLILVYVSGEARRAQSIGTIGRADRLSRHETQAERFCALVEAHFREPVTVGDYGAMMGVSAPHLTRVCKAILGSPPNELVRRRRLLEAKRLLEYTRLSVAEVSHRSGFQDPAFFSRTFRAAHGMPPNAYRAERDA